MKNCAFCGEDWDSFDNGVIVLHEKAPFKESIDDEIYDFCSHRCLKRWLSLWLVQKDNIWIVLASKWNVVASGNIAKNVLIQFAMFNVILVSIENIV